MGRVNVFLVSILLLSLIVRADGQPARERRVDNLFVTWNNTKAPGYAIGITQNNKLIYQKYFGLANLALNAPITARSIFDVGSVSKQFTAACVSILQTEGKLSINDTIRKFLPEFPAAYSKVRIRDLIYHTGGIRQWEMLSMLANKSLKDYYSNDIILESLKIQNGLNFEPGDKFLYSNGGYIILAEIIKRVSGKSLKEFANENIFYPLGMHHTFFVDDNQQIIKNQVTSYGRNDDKSFYQFINNSNDYGGGNLHSTIEDLSIWESNAVNNKLKYGKELQGLLFTSGKLNNGTIIDYGFGVETGDYHGLKCISHTGFAEGFRTRMVIFPKINLSVTFITNIADDIHSDSTAFDIALAYAPELFTTTNKIKEIDKTKPSVEPQDTENKISYKYSLEEFRQLEGFYYSRELNKVYKIKTADSTLIIQIDNDELKLVAEEKNKFSFQNSMILSFYQGDKSEGFRLSVGEEVVGIEFEKFNFH